MILGYLVSEISNFAMKKKHKCNIIGDVTYSII